MSEVNTQTNETNQDSAQNAAASHGREAELEAQIKDKEQKYVYLYAEFENFKKRVQKEREETLKYGWEPIARELLQVIDNLERAIQYSTKDTDSKLIEGLKMVLNHFNGLLERQGVNAVKTDASTFDPNIHDAVAEEPSDIEAGKITQVHTKGYTLHGRLLRPARVVLSSGKNSNSTVGS